MADSVQALIEELIEALATDAQRLRALLADDVVLLGTDPGEEFEGADAIVSAMAHQNATLGPLQWTSEGDRRLRQRADVAWFVEHGRLEFPEGGARVRLTGVAVQDPDGWKFAQAQVAPVDAPAQLA